MKTITLTKINNKEGFKFPISLNDGNDFLFFSKWTNLNQKDSLDNTFLMNFGNITENKEKKVMRKKRGRTVCLYSCSIHNLFLEQT